MTVVIAIDYLDELILIADTRITFNGKNLQPQKGLKKLFLFEGPGNFAVLGFAGTVPIIKKILRYIWSEKISNSKKPLVFAHLKDDLSRWLYDAARTLRPDERNKVEFLLCGFESRRRRRIAMPDGTSQVSPWFEKHIYHYKIRKSAFVKVEEKGGIAIIGSGEEHKEFLLRNIPEFIRWYSWEKTEEEFHLYRSNVVTHIIASMYERKAVETVGGPFQILRIAPPKATLSYWWEHSENETIEREEFEHGKTILKKLPSGETCQLFPIWTWS